MAGSTSQSPRASARRSRKSIAHFPGVSDKENNTISDLGSVTTAKNVRKTRSKSIGPGGLEVLNETAGNSQKVAPIVRSILKPTIPLSPIRQIPPRNKSAARSQTPSGGSQGAAPSQDNRKQDHDQAAEKAREKEKRELQERREARRKSLANRRVSFAPEATLHTWDIVELPEDATSSTEATNSTRRASSGSTLQSGTITGNQSGFGGPAFSDPPSTPPKHDIQVAASPADQRNLHQRQNRRDSDAFSVATEDLENFSSPGDSIASGNDVETDISDDSDEDKDSLIDSTETGRMNDDDSVHSEPLDQTGSTSSSARLDHSLRQAVIQAGNQDLTLAEGDDMTMDLVDDETALIPSITMGSARNAVRTISQENTNPFSPAFGATVESPDRGDETSEMSMDMTMMMGGIINGNTGSPKKGKRKSIAPTTRRSIARRRSSVDSALLADETMDFVTMYGGIQSTGAKADDITTSGEAEMSMDLTKAIGRVLPLEIAADRTTQEEQGQDVSMELTRAIGGLVPAKETTRSIRTPKRTSLPSSTEEAEMDITVANGRLLSPVTEYTEPSEHSTFNMDITQAVGGIIDDNIDETIGMDITKAVGSILPKDLKTDNKLVAKQLMEEEADHGQLTRSPFARKTHQETTKQLRDNREAENASANQSPHYLRTTRATSAKQNTPNKAPGTPSKQLTPQPDRPTTPSKTPPNPNISMRKTSPKRLFKSSTSRSPKITTPSLSASKGLLNLGNKPLVVLTPVSRRASGVGIDQIGMGSPMAAAKLDRRASIGDSTPNFVPNKRKGIRFEDPRTIELELDRERAEEEHRESGRGVLEIEADGDEQDATGTIRDVIKSLTPKKNKFKGRKSLAPSAKGILGKRPIELDDEEDEDATPKRLKGNRSPVKSIHLPGPQKDTTLRLSLGPQFAMPGAANTPVTTDNTLRTASTPKSHGRFKTAETVQKGTIPPASFNEQLEGALPDLPVEGDVRVSLQDFLNLTNIRFMDLTTTKRRHTVVASESKDAGTADPAQITLADCIVAGVCTIPMLDLFQHSCRELKKYISEGRSVVREIENDTLEENPALFREYMAATPDIREIMDNQFKNIKVHARGESKATWYEWRSKLFDGIKSGLVTIHEGLLKDDKLLGDQEELLHEKVTSIVDRHTLLKQEAESLQSQVNELANCDQNQLRSVREQLSQRDQDILDKKALLAELQAEFEQTKSDVSEAQERKMEVMAEIKEADRVTNENRGWSYQEVKLLKDKVDLQEQTTGWTLQTCDEFHPTFAFQRTLYLNIAANLGEASPLIQQQQPISLSYDPQNTTSTTEPSVIHRFFLQNLKSRLAVLPYNTQATELRSVLDFVSTGWEVAEATTAETSQIRSKFHTTEQILNDSTLQIQSMLLLRAPEETATQSKIHVQFLIKLAGEGAQPLSSKIETKAKVIYGEAFKEKEIVKFLESRIKNANGKLAMGGWKDALVDLKAALLKGKIGVSVAR